MFEKDFTIFAELYPKLKDKNTAKIVLRGTKMTKRTHFPISLCMTTEYRNNRGEMSERHAFLTKQNHLFIERQQLNFFGIP
jgi:hypothetical protein